MFVEFCVENFKSIRDRQYLLLEADEIDTKPGNVYFQDQKKNARQHKLFLKAHDKSPFHILQRG